jgi:hypothetical protein
MVSKTDQARVQISARIRQDLRDVLKASQDLNGRTWEREVEAALDYAIANGYLNERKP